MADLFPTIEDATDAEFYDGNLDEDVLNETTALPIPYGFTWAFDFSAGDIALDNQGNTQRVEGHRTLHEWIGHTLSTERYETPIFGGDIGTIINKLVGEKTAADPLTLSTVEREISEAIRVHDRVAQIENFAVIPLDHDIFVYMRLLTDDAAVVSEVVAM